VTVPAQAEVLAQRCDLILDAHGALRIVLAGDWIAPSERWVIEQVFSDVRDLAGPVSLDTGELCRVSDEIRAIVDSFGAHDAR